ncbi:MAG: hypothetical protein GY698_24205 [Actinomycetia bacterium]|nr:hypothetical protein [Actinomycetes bacterium]
MTDSGKGPLDGVTVVEITSIYSGPYAGMMLAEMGDDVVKVEGPDQPDPVRAGLGSDPGSVNSIFYALNRGKRFASLDARTERGRELLFELVGGADVFLHNMRAGKAAALGLRYDDLAELYTRERTDRGQQVEIPMIGVGLHFSWSDAFAPGILLPPWDGLCLALDRAQWVVDERFAEPMARILNFPDLLDAVRTEVAKHTTGEVLARHGLTVDEIDTLIADGVAKIPDGT